MDRFSHTPNDVDTYHLLMREDPAWRDFEEQLDAVAQAMNRIEEDAQRQCDR